ncbi:MAG: polysaccharide deacetylase family protein [Pseudomonadota bacterium]
MKPGLKIVAYRAGLLGAFHRLRNRRRLTIAMFHRVLPRTDPRYPGADPEWTMTPDSFAACLGFFQRHYHVLTPEQVFAALNGQFALPSRSLLVSFDDGWADTADQAMAVLHRFDIRALVFITADAIGRSAPFWEEAVYDFLATVPGAQAQLLAAWPQESTSPLTRTSADQTRASEGQIRRLIGALNALTEQQRLALLAPLLPDHRDRPAMMNAGQLEGLVQAGHTVGGHGLQHRPVPALADPAGDMAAAQAQLARQLHGDAIASMSFPHGRWSRAAAAICRAAGFRHLFTSEAGLNRLDRPLPHQKALGRIHVSERDICGADGIVEPALLATWMFLRPTLTQAQMEGGPHG